MSYHLPSARPNLNPPCLPPFLREALRSSWRFWPFVHCISFSHAVPLDLKLLWVDVMEIVWVTILSRVANQVGGPIARPCPL